MMKTVTVTQEEYNKARECFENDAYFEDYLKDRVEVFKPIRMRGLRYFEIYHKAKLMLEKLQFEKYDLNSLEYDGSGEDESITYLEYKTGEALTEDELWELWHDQNKLYQELIIAKKG